jgi:hypothetical protein
MMEQMKEDKSRAVDVHWLQTENTRLNNEMARLSKESLERERGAYKQGKLDAEETGPIGEAFGIKDIGNILEVIKKNPPEPHQIEKAEPPVPAQKKETSLKSLIALIIKKQITPEAAPRVIFDLFGPDALEGFRANKAQIFQEMSEDPELLGISNGETPEIIKKLSEELDKNV